MRPIKQQVQLGSSFLVFWNFFQSGLFLNSYVLPSYKGRMLIGHGVRWHQDRLKTLIVGGWQDGWAGFQSWNLNDPAVARVNYVGMQLESWEAFCRRRTFSGIQNNLDNLDTRKSVHLTEWQDQKWQNNFTHLKMLIYYSVLLLSNWVWCVKRHLFFLRGPHLLFFLYPESCQELCCFHSS